MNILLLSKKSEFKEQCIVQNISQIDHVYHVLGLREGDSLKVGYRHGNLGTAIIAKLDIQRHQMVLTDKRCDTPPPAKLNLTVVMALPRPKVLRRLIMDMTAIGVNHIILVNSFNTNKSYWQSPMLERIDEFVFEGLQQGMDTCPPRVTLHKLFKPFVEDELSMMTTQSQAVVAHPYASMSFNDYQASQGLPKIICIGAEGGWIDYEIDLLTANGCEPVSLGNRILRTEAAVNVLCGRYL